MSADVQAWIGFDWSTILIPAVSLAEKVFRTVIVFVFLVIALRVAGKREIAQLNPFDFIVLLVLSNTLQNAVIGPDNSVTGGLIGAASLLMINWAVNRLLNRHPRWGHFLTGSRRLLMVGGKLDTKALQKELITVEELELAARERGIASLADVESAELDPNGELVFVTKVSPLETLRHAELLARIDQLTLEVKELRERP